MTNRRCIKCEVLKEEKKNFTKAYTRFCDPCYMGMENNAKVRRFENIFLSAAQEIFCLQYSAGTSHLAVEVPDDDEGRKKLFKEGKRRVEASIKRENGLNKNDENHEVNIHNYKCMRRGLLVWNQNTSSQLCQKLLLAVN